jgi:hypothetical protein
MVQYSVLSSSNSMAAHRLNPLPATPFSGRCILGRSVGWAVTALRKASFSAGQITEVSTKMYEVHSFLPFSFFNFAA